MLRMILLPLDGSPFGEAAAPVALKLARAASGSVHLALAHRPIVPLGPVAEAAAAPPSLDEDLRTRERAYLEARVAVLTRKGGPEITHAHLDGPPGQAVVAEANRIGADLIVMAAHGRGALGRLWLGSVADHVIRHAAMPVLLVRPETGEAAAAEATPLRRILVPLDLSAESEAVLETVAEIAILAEAGVTLLHIVEPFFDLVDPAAPYPLAVDSRITEGRLNEAERRLERAAGRLRDAGIRVETRILESTSAAGGILEALERDEADLVAMTTHGEGGVRRLVLGSVTDKVIRGSRKPVLAMRPPAPKEEP